MSTQRQEALPGQSARDTAGILAKGYNEHIRLHGPDGSTAAGGDQLRDIVVMDGGYGFIVRRDGYEMAVMVVLPEPGQSALSVFNGDQQR
jgi:hypothetical protein